MNYIYRMTHIDNIPHILKYGITHRLSDNANANYKSIGDPTIIQKRSLKVVRTVEGEEFTPGDYIPFYFYVRMPMLYNIQHGYNVEKVAAENIVYLVVKLDSIIKDDKYEFFFSDRHAVNKQARFYGKDSIDRIDNILDIDAIRNNAWGYDYITRERKQAEFLVGSDIPAEHIVMLGCYNEIAKTKLISYGVQCEIRVDPNAYF